MAQCGPRTKRVARPYFIEKIYVPVWKLYEGKNRETCSNKENIRSLRKKVKFYFTSVIKQK
jgi:hypothetical protein